MEPKRRLLELLLSPDAPSWRVRRIVVEEHGRDERDERVVSCLQRAEKMHGIEVFGEMLTELDDTTTRDTLRARTLKTFAMSVAEVKS